jgi:hypothetical protein
MDKVLLNESLNKTSKRKILALLTEQLKDKFPNVDLQHSNKENDDRVVIPLNGNDSFIFYFSDMVENTLRLGFVIDLDLEDSERRKLYEEILSNEVAEIEALFGTKVFSANKLSKIKNMSDENIIKQGVKEWLKISHHRRKGIYKMKRIEPNSFKEIDEIVATLIKEVLMFIDSIDSLIHKYRIP